MKITKYRTVAIIYPYLSLECEVMDGDKKYYPNISVNDEGKKEEFCVDAQWCYNKPMDKIGYDDKGNEVDYEADYSASIAEVDEDIYKQMYEFWNKTPVFDNNAEWKEWKYPTEEPHKIPVSKLSEEYGVIDLLQQPL